MVMVPQFQMGSVRDDFVRGTRGISNALGQWQARNADAERMAQQNRQFEATNALAERQFGEQQRQFNSNFGLRRSEMEEANRRFGLSHSLDERRVAATEAESSDRRMKTALDQAAGVAQMVQSNPALASQRWQKMIASNPMWSKVLAEAGIDPTDWKGGSDYIISRARGFTAPQQAKLTELSPGSTLFRTDPRTGETTQIAQAPRAAPTTETTLTKEVSKARVGMAEAAIKAAIGAQESASLVGQLEAIAQKGLGGSIGPIAGSSTYQTIVGGMVPFSETMGLANRSRNAEIRRLQDQLVLAGGEKMRGLGAQSDADSARLEKAVGDLASARNPQEFNAALAIIKNSVQGAIARGRAAVAEFPELGAQFQASGAQPSRIDPSTALNDARRAISAGASRDAVIQRLREHGIDPAGL